jgi:HD-GYP domain-containing protein (c-di-GMP phosphodiesterase class II)
MLNVVPLRRAKPGAVLEKAAFDREGRVIAEAGKELSEERIRQFKNLNVRKIVISDTIVQWIPTEDAESYADDVKILETRDFDEAAGEIVDSLQTGDSVEQLRKIALYLRQQASRSGDAGGVAYLDDLIDRSYELEEQIADLTDRLENVENEQAREKIMEALEGKIRRIDEMFMEISSPESIVQETVDAVGEKEEIRSSLSNYVTENPEILDVQADEDSSSAPDIETGEEEWGEPVRTMVQNDVLLGIKEFIARAKDQGVNSTIIDQLQALEAKISSQMEEKDQLEQELSEFDLDLDQRKKIMDALNGRVNLQKTELLTLPISQQFASKTYELMQEELDCRYRLWEAAEEATDGDLSGIIEKTDFLRETRSGGETSPDDEFDDETSCGKLSEEELYDVLDNLEQKEDLREGVRRTVQILEENDEVDTTTTSQFNLIAEKIQDVSEDVSDLKERVREEVDDEKAREAILETLEGERPFDPDTFFERNAPMGLLEDVADCITERNDQRNKLWNELNSLTDQRFYREDDEDNLDRIDDKIKEAARELSVGDHSGGTPGDPFEESPAREDGPSLLQLIRSGDTYEIANETGLDRSTVEDAKMCLQSPPNLSSDQKFYFEPLMNETRKIFYGREMNEDVLLDSARDLADEMAGHSRPLKMFNNPPSGDGYVLSHALNTCLVTLSLANQFSFDDEEILDLTAASLSMDLGMIEIPTGLWARNDELTQRGDKEVKQHPKLSRSIVEEAVNGDRQVQDLVHQHHERSDGSGYPRGIDKDEQHPLANIVGVCDAYVAMLETRSYRDPMSPDTAMMTLLRNRDEFDNSVVKALVETIGIYPNGSMVLLSDTRMALVKSQKSQHPTKPDLLIISDRDQNRLDTPVPTNLREEDVSVEKILKW